MIDRVEPRLERHAEIPAETMFWFGGRLLKVVSVSGVDARAPVMVEEMTDGPTWIAGQLAMWSLGGITQALAAQTMEFHCNSTVDHD